MNMSSPVTSSGQTTAQARHIGAAGAPFRGQTTVNEVQQTVHRVSA